MTEENINTIKYCSGGCIYYNYYKCTCGNYFISTTGGKLFCPKCSKSIEYFIADEDLQKGSNWESIGIVKITEENIDNVGYWFKEYKNKNIEIAVREVVHK